MIYKRLFWVGTIVAAWQFLGCSKLSEPFEPAAYATGTVPFQENHRKAYQYSVIPGGVYSGVELARARRTDPVVAKHYSDFSLDAHVTRLTQDELVYISYRKADKVFWSQKKHRVCAGEAVVTDGKNTARSRCGNRLSKVPKLPTAKAEPSETLLNTPELPAALPGVQSGAGSPFDMANLPSPLDPGTAARGGSNGPNANNQLPPVATGGSSPLGPATTGASGRGAEFAAPASFFPAFAPYYGSGGALAATSSSTTSGTGTTTVTSGGTTTTVIPEPSAMLLILAGGLLGGLSRKLR